LEWFGSTQNPKTDKIWVDVLCNLPWPPNHSPWWLDTGVTRLPLASNSPWWVVTIFKNSALRKNLHFHSKTPILIPQHPNSFLKFVQTFIDIKRHSKPYKTWIRNIIPSKSPINPFFIKLPRTIQFFTTNSIIMTTRVTPTFALLFI